MRPSILYLLVLSVLMTPCKISADEIKSSVYQQKNYEIYAPQLSPDNSMLLFVRKWHVPTGHEAEMFSDEELANDRTEIKNNERLAYPEIVLMDLNSGELQHIDYGWDPVFSHDQSKIAYAHQLKPLSGFWVASAFEGNEIREYDQASGACVTLAKPTTGYFSRPVYAEHGTVLFALSDAVNGDWGGDIGVGESNGQTGRYKVLFSPQMEHGLHHLVEDYAAHDGQRFVFRRRPLTEGLYLADAYAYELVNPRDESIWHGWGEHRLDNYAVSPQANFRICPSGPEVYSDGWKQLAQIHPDSPRVLSTASDISSPNCQYTASFDRSTVTICAVNGVEERHWSAAKGEILSLAWSSDSSRVILVLSHGADFLEKFERDEIIILQVSELPGK